MVPTTGSFWVSKIVKKEGGGPHFADVTATADETRPPGKALGFSRPLKPGYRFPQRPGEYWSA